MDKNIRKQAEEVFNRHDIYGCNYIEINELKKIFRRDISSMIYPSSYRR